MTTKHTPGPWTIDEIEHTSTHSLFYVLDDDEETIATCEDEANAHLIAAAPDLLAALTTMMWCVDAGYTVIKNGVVYDAQTQLAVEAIRAAIAKAKGETK